MDKVIGKILLTFGVLFLIAGFLLYKGIKIPFGKLPGDIVIKRENFAFYFPLATCIIISLILT
ncbi:MAG TPA: DUF2905 domain-containing protein, partial [Firmicutes bacterium]|nr:DUF2905 domain-containing protein [Bacillota bacterium]